MIESVVIGLGGNVGTDAEIIDRFRAARAALSGVRCAPLYRSAAIGPVQPRFLNTAIEVHGDADPAALLATLLALEASLGRIRARESRWGPRTIDLDVLVWGARTIALPELTVPHPRLAERRFALLPLVALLGPDLVVPGAAPAGVLLAAVAGQVVDELGTW